LCISQRSPAPDSLGMSSSARCTSTCPSCSVPVSPYLASPQRFPPTAALQCRPVSHLTSYNLVRAVPVHQAYPGVCKAIHLLCGCAAHVVTTFRPAITWIGRPSLSAFLVFLMLLTIIQPSPPRSLVGRHRDSRRDKEDEGKRPTQRGWRQLPDRYLSVPYYRCCCCLQKQQTTNYNTLYRVNAVVFGWSV
jgi:hypothetical protein